ncbi:bifunctional adenosylcobinamide kinase/adenosylcobinamide-phosphate guanylyltransferase [Desulforegula conservatrix]|uniref:bifunctional adenosylcobinamide kinase/adenosylcobinamide-phosphate guanylyltransferase n=1 Tax=Desulforegula conservatrix TaxID=153026 RepID=UPI0003F6E45B|nr:bifunctional adenosylcobinamide kinase/adenosylcobinamide-phosphate guanylyltransferase [Desulforegula conservatrix]
MGKIVFITGGCRSGKSAYALKIAEEISKTRIYLATCPSGVDDEMDSRIEKHINERDEGWKTVDEPVDIAGVILEQGSKDVILVDCLTLWVSNLMQRAFNNKIGITEEEVSDYCMDIIKACQSVSASVIFVTNETGMGIVPDNKASRDFRDLLGRCNQVMASRADSAYLMVSGIPLKLK